MNALPENLIKRNLDPRITTTIVILSICFLFVQGIWIVGYSPLSFNRFMYTTLQMVLVLVPPMLLWYYYDKGYQVGWDENGIYARLSGFRLEGIFSEEDRIAVDHGRLPGILGWFTRPAVSFMAFEDIVEMGGDLEMRLRKKTGRRSIGVLYISGTAQPPGIYNNLIGILFPSFKRESILDFMEALYDKRPELVTRGWEKAIKKRRAANDR